MASIIDTLDYSMNMASEIPESQLSSFDIRLRSNSCHFFRAASSTTLPNASFADDTIRPQQASRAFFSDQTIPNMLPRSDRPKRILDEEEWETLRPVIQLHYIYENKTFVEVARILKQKYRFEPTKKQFTTRTEKWGMKKNVSRSERRKFLQSENKRQNLGITDPRLSPAKVANWRKRYKYEARRAGRSANQQPNFAAQSTRTTTESIESDGEPFSQSTALAVIMESPVLENFRLAAAFGCEAMEIEILDTPKQDPVPMEIDKWPFDWASVNITGPTGLTELFRGLEIDCANSAPQLTSDAQSPEEPMFISNTELQSLWNPRNHSKISDVDNISDSRQQHLARSVPQHLKKSFPKDPSVVFFDYTESPYNEVYVFPSSHRTITAKPAIPRITLWTELEAQESDLQSKLRVLKQSLPLYHPGIIATTEELAHVCFNRAKYKKAEILYRQVVSARLKTPGTSPLKMLAACMDVVDALREMDKYRQSQTLLLKIMGVLQKLVSPEHELAVKALFKLGLVAKYLEDYEQAEDLFSQVLQIRLGIWGPRYLESSASIADLGELLARMGRIAESEKLLRTSLQLFTEIGGVKEEYVCSSMSDLSWSLTVQQSYEEGESLARQALERSERSLGPLAVTTLSAQYALAWNLKNTGRLSESEKLFQRNYRQRSKALGRKDADTLHAAHTLATVVQELGRMKEAIGLHEEVFRVSVDVLGPTQRSTKNSCVDLGGCYEDQGRYEDAVELYTKFVEKLREEGGDGDPEIMMFEYSINLNQERIWEREGWTSEEEDEIGEGNKSREENESQEDDESYENDDHSVGEVEKVEEDEDVEKSKEIAGAEGVCFEGETLSEEEV